MWRYVCLLLLTDDQQEGRVILAKACVVCILYIWWCVICWICWNRKDGRTVTGGCCQLESTGQMVIVTVVWLLLWARLSWIRSDSSDITVRSLVGHERRSRAQIAGAQTSVSGMTALQGPVMSSKGDNSICCVWFWVFGWRRSSQNGHNEILWRERNEDERWKGSLGKQTCCFKWFTSVWTNIKKIHPNILQEGHRAIIWWQTSYRGRPVRELDIFRYKQYFQNYSQKT